MKNTWENEFPQFKPDYTPIEMARLGIFKGAYFSESSLDISELNLPAEFFKDIKAEEFNLLTRTKACVSKNLYKVDCGMSYDEWLDRGWINKKHPYGWYNWYICFYYGERSSDDARQISRWCSFAARHFGMLKFQCYSKKKDISDISIGLKTRQNLLHWAFKGF